jgi:hypothetical protein
LKIIPPPRPTWAHSGASGATRKSENEVVADPRGEA